MRIPSPARRLLWLVAALLLAAPVPIAWFDLEVNARIEGKREAVTRELPGLLAGDDPVVRPILTASPLFAAAEGEDAGSFLNDRLGWKGDDRGTLLTPDCRKRLTDAGTEWRTLRKEQVAGCDPRWLHELRRFGRWSLTSGYRERLAGGPRDEFALPNLMDLQDAVKLHLVGSDDPEAAAQDVRHLARLLFTQQYLMSAMFGIALLSIENRSWELSGKAWSAPPLATSDREVLRLHLLATGFVLNPLIQPTLVDSIVEDVPGFRRCMLITEQSFAQRRGTLPEPNGCDFEHARWELAHPWQQTPGDPTEALSWPATWGASITRWLAPARYQRMAELLLNADELPANGRWASRRSEHMDRLLGPR